MSLIKGYKQTKEHRRKISEALKRSSKTHHFKKGNPWRFEKGENGWMGRKHKKVSKRKMSEKAKLRIGMKNSNWRGGISFELYPTDWTDNLKESIRQRDNYICQMCGIHQDELKRRLKKLDIHHIDYNKDNLTPDNLIALCRECHAKTNFDRDYWSKYLNDNN